jgi:hypothetical protein
MKASRDKLEELHNVIAEELLLRIRSGEAKPADMANAIKFLKDNNIEGLVTDDSPMYHLLKNIPFPTKENLLDN